MAPVRRSRRGYRADSSGVEVNVALSGRIRQATTDLERVVSRAEELMEKARQTGDDGYYDGVALNLHGFYAGVERIFEDIARAMEESVPDGADWHQSLLLQMAADMVGVRPSVLTQKTRYSLDEYRGFRRVVRNVYTFNLRPARLQELVEGLRSCYESLMHDVGAFADFLDEQPQDKKEGEEATSRTG